MTRTALAVLGYRYPTDDADLDALLAGTALPDEMEEEAEGNPSDDHSQNPGAPRLEHV